MNFLRDKIIHPILQRPPIGLAVIILFTAFIYSNILDNSFIMDDYGLAMNWPAIESLNNLPQFFGSESQPQGDRGVYLPLKILFHAIYYHFWGLTTFGYHISAITLHLLITVIMYMLALHLTRNTTLAFFSALFFGIHPVHSEAVTFMTVSVDLVGILFLAVSFWLYIRAQEGAVFKKWLYVASVIYGALAVLSYELATCLPVLILGYQLWRDKKDGESRSGRSSVRLAVPYFILVGLYVVMKWLVVGTVAGGEYLKGSLYLTMLVTIKAFAKYILILFWPATLSINHIISKGIFSFDPADFDQQAVLFQSFFDPQVLLSLALIAAVIYSAFRLFKKQPVITFCVGWFFVNLLPVSNIVPSSVFFAERYLYLASFGFCLILAHAVSYVYHLGDRVSGKKFFFALGAALTVVLISFYSWRTVTRNLDWRNDFSFYLSGARTNPESARMQSNLGLIYIQYGLNDNALDIFKRAAKLNPDDANIYFMMAEAYTGQGKHFDAIAALKKAVEVNPDFPEAYFNMAIANEVLGYSKEAEELLNTSLELYRKQGRNDEAEDIKTAFYDYVDQVRTVEPE